MTNTAKIRYVQIVTWLMSVTTLLNVMLYKFKLHHITLLLHR